MIRKLLQNLMLISVGLLVALTSSEILTRMLVPQIGWRPFRDNYLGWSSKQYQQFDPVRDENSTKKTRILVLGDSFLAGSGVSNLDERFPIKLNRMLGDRFEIQILATGGWGTDQQYLAYLEKGKLWRPNLVIVAFTANNDISNILSNSHGDLGPKPYFSINNLGQLQLYDFEGEEISFPSENYHRGDISSHSYFFDLIRYSFRSAEQKSAKSNFEKVDPRYLKFEYWKEQPEELYTLTRQLSWSPEVGNTHVSAYIHENFEMNSYQWKLLEMILKEWRDETNKIDANLLVMLLPVTFKPQDVKFIAGGELNFYFQTPNGGFTFRAAEPRDRLLSISSKQDIKFFDPTPEFISFIQEHNLVEAVWPDPTDRHFSDIAHSILSEQMFNYLQENPSLLKR